MEDDSLQHQSTGSARYPVKGMESVVATVSGYHGSERFNLIKLISSTGASYVGNMNQSITHLVCWKFEGRKYELAKKFKTVIVNHCWIEECVKKGHRVSESPYTFECGQEMGTPCMDIPLGFNLATAQSKAWKKSKEIPIDIQDEEMHNDSWTGLAFSNENSFSELRQNSHSSIRLSRKTNERSLRKDRPGSSMCRPKTVISGPKIVEIEEPSTSKPHFRRLRKRNSISLEPHCKDHRLVKKHISIEDLACTSNMEQECQEVKLFPDNYSSEIPSNGSDVDRHQSASNRHASDMWFLMSWQSKNDALVDVEEVDDVNDERENTCVQGAQSLLKTPEEQCQGVHEDFIDIDYGNRLTKSTDLSCVICWTDFSSTRGVLPCGHRFCFSCIQSWADHMASRKKSSTCPLCKASFICITKVEDAVSSDQKIYSQTIPYDSSKNDVYILPDEANTFPANPSAQVCFQCSSREPEDLLVKCYRCQIRCVHSYCLDPPLFPWTCVHCKDLQMLYFHNRLFT